MIEVGNGPALARLMRFTPIGSKVAVMMQANERLCSIGLGQGMLKSESQSIVQRAWRIADRKRTEDR